MKTNIVVGFFAVIILSGVGMFLISKRPTSAAVPESALTEKSYTISDVASHNTAKNCWSIINGNVYDLTSFIGLHPGGPMRILSICGKDGSAAFNAQHGSQPRPQNELTGFLIGKLLK